MKRQFQLVLLFLFVAADIIYAQTPAWQWGRSAEGAEFDHANTLCTDRHGNVFVAGYYSSDKLIFDTDTLINSGIGFDEIFVAKYDSAGNILWAESAGGNGDDKATAVTTDADGNVYVAGYFYTDTINFGAYTLVNAGAVGDIFIVKYDQTGNVMWAKREGGPALEIPYALSIDGSGNIIVVGRFSSLSITFGTTILALAGANDVFVVKYNSDANIIWAKSAGGGSIDEAFSVSVDAADNIYVAGHFNQNATFGSYSLSTSGSSDIFIAKYDTSGAVLWATKTGGNGDDRANAIATDALGNSYVAGFFQSESIAFGATILTNFYNQGNDNAFVAKFDANGSAVWAHAINGKSKAYGITITPDNVYACGSFKDDQLNFGPSILTLNGSADFFLVNCDTSGSAKWAMYQTSGGESSESASAVVADVAGNVYIGGDFGSHEPVTFGTSVLSPTDNSFDIFIARLGIGTNDIEEPETPKEPLIYPNPCTGKFILKSDHNIVTLEIYSLSGIIVFESERLTPQQENEINVSTLPAGIYVAKIYVGEWQYCKKLIIQKN